LRGGELHRIVVADRRVHLTEQGEIRQPVDERGSQLTARALDLVVEGAFFVGGGTARISRVYGFSAGGGHVLDDLFHAPVMIGQTHAKVFEHLVLDAGHELVHRLRFGAGNDDGNAGRNAAVRVAEGRGRRAEGRSIGQRRGSLRAIPGLRRERV